MPVTFLSRIIYTSFEESLQKILRQKPLPGRLGDVMSVTIQYYTVKESGNSKSHRQNLFSEGIIYNKIQWNKINLDKQSYACRLSMSTSTTEYLQTTQIDLFLRCHCTYDTPWEKRYGHYVDTNDIDIYCTELLVHKTHFG